jgi:hypothetical protein
MQIQFKQWNCEVVKRFYNNGRPALELIEVGTGEPVAVATVNVPDECIPGGFVAVKDYSENEGMLAALVLQHVVESPKISVASGFVTIPVCRLLI